MIIATLKKDGHLPLFTSPAFTVLLSSTFPMEDEITEIIFLSAAKMW